MQRKTGFAFALLALLITSEGCHTALRRPPRLVQWSEDRVGDGVDRCGRSTPISNQGYDHWVTRFCEGHRVTRRLGEHVMTGGYYSHPERNQGCQNCWFDDCR